MIGLFDSGFGGLHVLKYTATHLPQYGYIYLGDSARAPYGSRSSDEVYAFTKQGVDFLFAHGATIVVLACNTASSDALRKIQTEYGNDKKVLGVLIPLAEAAAARTKNKKVGVMATEGTVKWGAFLREITKLGAIEVFQEACPEFVPLIEAGQQHSKRMTAAIARHVAPLVAAGVDTIVLGCTHYGIIEDQIQKAAGQSIAVVSEVDVVPPSLENYLQRHPEFGSRIAQDSSRHFFTTGDVKKFDSLGSRLFGSEIHAAHAELL